MKTLLELEIQYNKGNLFLCANCELVRTGILSGESGPVIRMTNISFDTNAYSADQLDHICRYLKSEWSMVEGRAIIQFNKEQRAERRKQNNV